MLKRLLAEGLGSLLLAATVIGSGIMAEQLAGGNLAVALLANTGATVAVLAVLIALLGPISGAHFNPVVSLVMALRRTLPWREAGAYAVVQVMGCCLGAMLAHAMFALPLLQDSVHARTGPGQWLAEVVATSGLVLVVLGHRRAADAPGWWPAGLARPTGLPHRLHSRTRPSPSHARSPNTFAGIRPVDAPAFIVAQVVGALVGMAWRADFRGPGTAPQAKSATMLRPCTPGDAAQICEIYNYYVRETVVTFEESPVTEVEMAQSHRRCHYPLPWLVREEGGSITGYAYATPWKARAAYRHAVECSIYLAPHSTGRGLGLRLYSAHSSQELRQKGLHCVIGGAALPNPASVALHERLGFSKVAEFREVGFKFGKWIDVAYWELML